MNGLDKFIADYRTILDQDASAAGREKVRQKLEMLLRDEDFLKQYDRRHESGAGRSGFRSSVT